MGRELKVDWQEEPETLKKLYQQEEDHQNRTRLHALWLLRIGHSAGEVAKSIGVDERTIREWVRWYRNGGIEEILRRRHGGHGGKKARLSKEREAKLKKKTESGDIRTIWEGVDWVKKQFKVAYTYWGMRHVFERLKLHKKVPRPKSNKASSEKQKEWKESEMREELDKVDGVKIETIVWGDEMRVGLIGQVRRVWAPRGVKIEQAVEIKYEWTYLNLAVNGLAGTLRWAWMDDMKAKTIAPVVKEWGEDGVKVIIWDRAPGHRGAAYLDVNVKRVEQPPYSPELNPAERVIEVLRAAVEGKVYGTIKAKKEAIEEELEKLAAAPEKIRKLTGWNWIWQAVAGLA